MIDGHIHFEKQPYTIDLIEKMVNIAISKGIDEIWLLDHTHKFKEFGFLYSTLRENLTIDWYKKKSPIPIQEYLDFIALVKSKKWPIKIKFGLEVCYFPEHEEQLVKTLNKLPKFDFLIGSVHFEFGTAIDYKKELQEKFDITKLYVEYFDIQKKMVESHIFDVIGHPDAIKLYNLYPKRDLYLQLIEDFAVTLCRNNQMVENNTGLLRHGFQYGGMSEDMLRIFAKYDIKYHKSSDAHVIDDIGRAFESIKENI